MFFQPGADLGEITALESALFFVIELPMIADIAAGKAKAPKQARQPAAAPAHA